MHSQYSYPIHQCNPLEIPKGLAFLGVSLQQNTVVAEVLLLKTFPWKACHEREENNAYRNRKLYCPILPPLCIGKRITWEPKDSCFPISAGRLIGSLIVSHVHTTTAGYCILYISIYYERERHTHEKGHHTNTPPLEETCSSLHSLLPPVFYTETLLVRTLIPLGSLWCLLSYFAPFFLLLFGSSFGWAE